MAERSRVVFFMTLIWHTCPQKSRGLAQLSHFATWPGAMVRVYHQGLSASTDHSPTHPQTVGLPPAQSGLLLREHGGSGG